jgi:amino acid transporter
VWGAFWVLVFLAILNSEFANQNAASAAATRTWFSMGRIRLLPHILSSTNPRWRSPHIAIFAQLVLTIVLGIWLGFKYGPYNAFLLLATILTAIMILIYLAMSVSCFAYYVREQRAEFNWFLHLVVPLVGVAFLVPVWLASLGLGRTLFTFISPLTSPADLTAPVVLIWYVIGVAYLIYLATTHPDRLAETQLIFEGEHAGETDLTAEEVAAIQPASS